jgi:ribosomal-protein-alanine N-acetyltransferase
MPPELRDEVVTLRQWRVEDAAWYAECIQDPQVQRFTTDPPTLTAEDVAAAISALADRPERVAYLVADAVSGQPVGNIALDQADGVGDVSYWVAAAARGRGVATRALKLLAAAALEDLELRELRLWTHAANTASRRVAERADFHRVPARDQLRDIKGEAWPTVAYTRLG